jgi:NAD dependent epimerase/dehydratase family enzyme
MKILVSGSHGLVGKALTTSLVNAGHQIVSLVRQSANDSEIEWHPNQGKINGQQLEGFDVVVHLAGESIASGRWTEEKKKKIRESRGRELAQVRTAQLSQPPQCSSVFRRSGLETRRRVVYGEERQFLPKFVLHGRKQQSGRSEGIRTIHTRFGTSSMKKEGRWKNADSLSNGSRRKVGNGKQWMS